MKQIFSILLVLALVIPVALPARAATQSVAELERQVRELLVILQRLQAQVVAMQSGSSGGSSNFGGPGSNSEIDRLIAELRVGSSGTKVSRLQTLLNQTIGAGLPVTGYYGGQTQAAVARYRSRGQNVPPATPSALTATTSIPASVLGATMGSFTSIDTLVGQLTTSGVATADLRALLEQLKVFGVTISDLATDYANVNDFIASANAAGGTADLKDVILELRLLGGSYSNLRTTFGGVKGFFNYLDQNFTPSEVASLKGILQSLRGMNATWADITTAGGFVDLKDLLTKLAAQPDLAGLDAILKEIDRIEDKIKDLVSGFGNLRGTLDEFENYGNGRYGNGRGGGSGGGGFGGGSGGGKSSLGPLGNIMKQLTGKGAGSILGNPAAIAKMMQGLRQAALAQAAQQGLPPGPVPTPEAAVDQVKQAEKKAADAPKSPEAAKEDAVSAALKGPITEVYSCKDLPNRYYLKIINEYKAPAAPTSSSGSEAFGGGQNLDQTMPISTPGGTTATPPATSPTEFVYDHAEMMKLRGGSSVSTTGSTLSPQTSVLGGSQGFAGAFAGGKVYEAIRTKLDFEKAAFSVYGAMNFDGRYFKEKKLACAPVDKTTGKEINPSKEYNLIYTVIAPPAAKQADASSPTAPASPTSPTDPAVAGKLTSDPSFQQSARLLGLDLTPEASQKMSNKEAQLLLDEANRTGVWGSTVNIPVSYVATYEGDYVFIQTPIYGDAFKNSPNVDYVRIPGGYIMKPR